MKKISAKELHAAPTKYISQNVTVKDAKKL
jgi:hypothetical protein